MTFRKIQVFKELTLYLSVNISRNCYVFQQWLYIQIQAIQEGRTVRPTTQRDVSVDERQISHLLFDLLTEYFHRPTKRLFGASVRCHLLIKHGVRCRNIKTQGVVATCQHHFRIYITRYINVLTFKTIFQAALPTSNFTSTYRAYASLCNNSSYVLRKTKYQT